MLALAIILGVVAAILVILGIICFFSGKDRGSISGAICGLGVVFGILCFRVAEDMQQPQWSDWQEAEDSFLLQEVEEDTYVVEQADGTYVCKALTYSSTGETEETYKVIEKSDNITVKFLDLMEGEKPYGEVLERTSNDETQTMYVFHVPATEN